MKPNNMKVFGENYLDTLSNQEIEIIADRYFEDLEFEDRAKAVIRKGGDIDKLRVERLKIIKNRVLVEKKKYFEDLGKRVDKRLEQLNAG